LIVAAAVIGGNGGNLPLRTPKGFASRQRQLQQGRQRIHVKRILVIRGGAIGDFILTLPALRLLRENFTSAHIEILGYKHIVALAENRYYANATRSIDYAPLSRLFARDAELPRDLIEYFGSFDLIVSYLFDPDEIFATNLRRCSAARLILGSPKFSDSEHAARQLAAPLRQLGLQLADHAATLFPSEIDRTAAAEFPGHTTTERIVAIHPGSGSEKKNWPIENWIELGNHLLGEKPSRRGGFQAADCGVGRFGKRPSLIVIEGEADTGPIARLKREWKGQAVRFATNLPLPHLAAVLENAIFVGHDSGISHLAAAAGAKCILLFGPTDPAVWAPANENVKVLRAPEGDLARLPLANVIEALCHPERSEGPRKFLRAF
jgi:heptosyltransferase-2